MEGMIQSAKNECDVKQPVWRHQQQAEETIVQLLNQINNSSSTFSCMEVIQKEKVPNAYIFLHNTK